MGMDWRGMTWWEYQAARWNWNRIHSGEKPAPDLDRLKAIAGAALN
jgi:hypothetical protein